MANANTRPDHNGTQRAQFESNKKKIYATQKICGICGKPVDFKLKFPQMPLFARENMQKAGQQRKWLRIAIN